MVIDTMVFAYGLLRVEEQHEQAIAALEQSRLSYQICCSPSWAMWCGNGFSFGSCLLKQG